MKYLWIIPFCSGVLAACSGQSSDLGENSSDSTEEVCILPAPNRIAEVSWLLGGWESVENGVTTTETWVQSGDLLLSGEGCSVENQSGDTVFYELITIHHESTGLVYSPVVSNQNDGEAIDFLMTELTDSTLVFMNEAHDFPTRIAYQRIGTDSLIAIVSGTLDNTYQEDVIRMKRVRQ